ncbi:hypothetical protein KB206_20600 [Microvirga sp. STS02]|uniref:hypothetical protein n=1 Tax=Hymenobacter negativus TaxID=2795026 RepID=UPI0018DB72C0|nr:MULTISPECIES: hypothetical protein [Bacteria]MBH8571304.1 hypothetical protein [Hymenobacter negativus]MBR7211042.1 hypothetical protein [Microvirga sp. STS02]
MSATPSAKPQSARASKTDTLSVLTNQLLIEMPDDWSRLTDKFSIRRYQLNKSQHGFGNNADRGFYYRFPNDYKNQFDQPFYYFTKDDPYAALYTLVPHDAPDQDKPWLYAFGDSVEEIESVTLAPDEVRPHILLKLMLALCFYENGDNDKAYRVCQNKFFLWVKNSGRDFLTAIEVSPSVNELTTPYRMTLTVEARWFAKAYPMGERSLNSASNYYDLFHSKGHTYLRQVRPNQVATFAGDLYQPRKLRNNPHADWHNNGAKYKESRSYLVHHVQERLVAFLNEYGFRASASEEEMERLIPQGENLPVERFTAIQVVDNRLNKKTVDVATYMEWLTNYQYPKAKGFVTLPFQLVDASKLDNTKPVLVLNDVGALAFGYDEDTKAPRLLTAVNEEDPYQVFYKQFPAVVKQSLNVNYHKPEEFTVPEHYLEYALPTSSIRPRTKGYWAASVAERLAADQTSQLARNLEVCLSELWLKWVITGHATCSPTQNCLPFASQISDWGFMTDNLLLYFQDGNVHFANVATPEGKQFLKDRFTAPSKLIKHLMARTLEDVDKAEANLPKAFFVLIGKDVVFDIENTTTMALPNWAVIKPLKVENPEQSARTKEAIGVYAGGIWYNPQSRRYIVSGTESSAGKEINGHHIYQIHHHGTAEATHLPTLISLLKVTFVRKNRFTVLPYPFDLIRLKRELLKQNTSV